MDKVANISIETSKKGLKQIENSLKLVEIESARDPANEKLELFCKEVKSTYSKLRVMSINFDQLFGDISEYFVFDRKNYSLEQLCGDVKIFKCQFEKVKQFFITSKHFFLIFRRRQLSISKKKEMKQENATN